MKLARKISLAIALGICLVLVLDGLMRIDRQLTLFDTDMKRDHAAMSRVLQASLQEEWESGTQEKSRWLFERIKKRLVRVELRWLDVAHPEVPPDFLQPKAAAEQEERILSVAMSEGGKPFMATYFPIDVKGKTQVVVAIRESTAPRSRYVKRTIVRAIVTTGILLVFCVGVVFLLGHFFIGRPIEKLSRMAGQIAQGRYEQDISIAQSDEISDLAATMHEMSAEIDKAKERIQAESAARLATLEQLRHADKLKTVGQLTSGIVHELGTPLMVAAGRAKLISDGDVVSDEAADSARIVIEQIERVTTTIRQLLNFARKDMMPQRQVIDLGSVVAQTVQLLGPFATKSNVYLVFEPREHTARASLAQGHLEQVLTNLIINGMHATPSGGSITVKLTGEQPRTCQQGFVCLSVSDTGTGIAKEDISRIFEPFFTTKDADEGAGLGLSIANELIKEAGGEIEVETEEGVGTCFKVFLPVVGEEHETKDSTG